MALTTSELAMRQLDPLATHDDPSLTISNTSQPVPTAEFNPAGTNQGASGNTAEDMRYRTDINNLFRDTSNLDSDARLAADRTKSNSNNALNEAQDNYVKALESSKQYFAGSGTLRSGNFLKNQGEIATAHSKDNQTILSNAQMHLEDLARETASRKQAIELQRQQAEQRQADARAQAQLQRDLIQSKNEAYESLKSSLLGINNQSMNAYVSTPGGNGNFFKDPLTGGTLYDSSGNPASSSDQAKSILGERMTNRTRSRQPGDGLVWDNANGGYIENDKWVP